MSSGTTACADSAWIAPDNRIRISDAQHVADDIYSGAIGADQRRNLCRVMLGQKGVDLARKYDECDDAPHYFENKRLSTNDLAGFVEKVLLTSVANRSGPIAKVWVFYG
jgi:hypothetical protein